MARLTTRTAIACRTIAALTLAVGLIVVGRHMPTVKADGASALKQDTSGANRFRYNSTTGQWRFGNQSGTWSPGWTVRPAAFDLDSDTDFLVYSQETGQWAKVINNAPQAFQYVFGAWSPGWSTVMTLDLTNDDISDLFLYNQTTGAWAVCVSPASPTADFSCRVGQWSPGWSVAAAEWNNDGKADLFLYSKSSGAWFRVTTQDATSANAFSYVGGQWSPNWEPVVGDFNGNFVSDVFVYNPASGAWFLCTTNGTGFDYTPGLWSPGWQTIAADLDADGVTDIFLYSPASGAWFKALRQSAGAGFTYETGIVSPNWSVHAFDFNNDGRADILFHDSVTGFFFEGTNVPGGFSYVPGNDGPGGFKAYVPPIPLPDSPATPSAISPVSGLSSGGTPITITGANFRSGIGVTIGGVPAANVVVVNRNTITAVTPAHAAGATDVVLTRERQTRSLAGAYAFVDPPPPAPSPTPTPTPTPTPPPPPACPGVVCDDLQGGTIGQRIGGAFNGFGWQTTNTSSAIRYTLPSALTSGYFEVEVLGLRQQGDDGNPKWKLIQMYDGGCWNSGVDSGCGWDSGNAYTAQAAKRDGSPGRTNYIRFKFLGGDGRAGNYVESDTGSGWNPGAVYKLRMEWGGGSARLIVYNGDGTVKTSAGGGYRGVYNPSIHVAEVGSFVGGEHGSMANISYRNVRIGQ